MPTCQLQGRMLVRLLCPLALRDCSSTGQEVGSWRAPPPQAAVELHTMLCLERAHRLSCLLAAECGRHTRAPPCPPEAWGLPTLPPLLHHRVRPNIPSLQPPSTSCPAPWEAKPHTAEHVAMASPGRGNQALPCPAPQPSCLLPGLPQAGQSPGTPHPPLRNPNPRCQPLLLTPLWEVQLRSWTPQRLGWQMGAGCGAGARKGGERGPNSLVSWGLACC